MQGGGYKDIAEINEKKKRLPHLYNLNMDPQLTGHIIWFIDCDKHTVIGNGKDKETDLAIRGGRLTSCFVFFFVFFFMVTVLNTLTLYHFVFT